MKKYVIDVHISSDRDRKIILFQFFLIDNFPCFIYRTYNGIGVLKWVIKSNQYAESFFNADR